jgi:glycine/D-amino acid oxidase-like deaminating enzyme
MTKENESNYDVVVVGGGPSGFGAALGAARLGARTALIERHPFLGGMGTAALVNNFCPAHLDGHRLIIGGVFGELRRKLIEQKAIFSAPDDAGYQMETFDPEVYAELMASMCREAGVDLLLETSITGVEEEDDGMLRIELGKESLRAKTLVDATGDAVVGAQLGLEFTFGRAKDNAVMPLTYYFEIGPVDLDAFGAWLGREFRIHPNVGKKWIILWNKKITELVQEAKKHGEWSIPRDGGIMMNHPGTPENLTVNLSRVFCDDPTDPEQLQAAHDEGIRQNEDAARFFRKYVPGFENSKLIRHARQIGVRESRQIIGQYVLTGADALGCAQFDDVIAQSCYAIDIHDPKPDEPKIGLVPLERGTHFDIPWRCLIPKSGPGNLVIAGRCISADQEAMSSFRVAPSAMAIGEAAGVTAAFATQQGCPVADVGAKKVQARLLKTGGILS